MRRYELKTDFFVAFFTYSFLTNDRYTVQNSSARFLFLIFH